jgi:hypothetical protein
MRTVCSIKPYSVKHPRYPTTQATLKGTRLISPLAKAIGVLRPGSIIQEVAHLLNSKDLLIVTH